MEWIVVIFVVLGGIAYVANRARDMGKQPGQQDQSLVDEHLGATTNMSQKVPKLQGLFSEMSLICAVGTPHSRTLHIPGSILSSPRPTYCVDLVEQTCTWIVSHRVV